MTTTPEVLATTTIRPGDIIRDEFGTYHLVGELFDTGAQFTTYHYGGRCVSSRRLDYATLESLRVAMAVPRTHPSRAREADHRITREEASSQYRWWSIYERQINLNNGVVR